MRRRPPPRGAPRARFELRFDAALLTRARVAARARGLTTSALIAVAVEDFLRGLATDAPTV